MSGKSGRLPRPSVGFRWPNLLSLLGSPALAAVLLAGFCVWADISAREIWRLLLGVEPRSLLALVLLMSFNAFLAGEKWRLVMLRFGDTDRRDVPRRLCFALSAIGVCLGQLLPTQLATALVRSAGARAFGGRILRDGVGATLFEQLFDVVVAVVLGSAAMVVIVTAAGAAVWALCSFAAIIAGLALCGLGETAKERAFGRLTLLAARIPYGRLQAMLASVAEARLMAAEITLPLFVLSTLRIAVLVLVGGVIARAISLDIPLWHLAAAFPFAVLATALAVTPAALGIGELTFLSVLVTLGTSPQVAGQWVIATRILVIVAAGAMGVAGMAILGLARWGRPLFRAESTG